MTNNTDPVRAQDCVAVPRAFLEQVYGMAREGCEAPAVAYRWCERIDELFHGGSLDEHDEWARQLPDALASAPQPSFDRRFAEMLIGILGDVQDELGFTDEEKMCANGSAEIVSAIRELKERAASAPPSAPAQAAGDAVAVDDATVDRYLRAIHLHLGGLTDAEVRKEKRAGVYEANAVRAGLTAALAQDRASQAAAPSAPVGVEWPIIVEGLRLADRFFDGDDRYWKPASTVRAAYLAALAAQQQGGRADG